MPVYHVNYHAEAGSLVDDEGLHVACLSEALQFVYDLVRELRTDDPVEAHWSGCRFEVTDAAGSIMLTLPVPHLMGVIARRERH